jgi:two-component system CheB/CheR fusion protein
MPMPRRRLPMYGELLQVLGDALLRAYYRTRQYEQAAAIVDSSDHAIISKDLDSLITSWNRGAERLFGYAAQEAIGQPVTLLMPPPDRLDEESGILQRIRRGEKIDPYETARHRKDGVLLEVSLSISPLADVRGRIVGTSTIARDVTERKRQQRQRELLVHELNHRVKNTLMVVQSLAMQTLRHAATLAEGRAAFEARLMALAQAHDVLTREYWEGAGLGKVVADAMAAYSGDAQESRLRVAGPLVPLRPKAVLAPSMAL